MFNNTIRTWIAVVLACISLVSIVWGAMEFRFTDPEEVDAKIEVHSRISHTVSADKATVKEIGNKVSAMDKKFERLDERVTNFRNEWERSDRSTQGKLDRLLEK